MSYNTKHEPQVHDRTKHSGGNGGFTGRIDGHAFRPNDNGISYSSGIGCPLSDNCFDCPRSRMGLDCNFDYSEQHLKYMSNLGDGLKVCWED